MPYKPIVLPNEHTYRAVHAWATSEIESLRSRLESKNLTHDDTVFTRGEIARLRKLLKHLEENTHV